MSDWPADDDRLPPDAAAWQAEGFSADSARVFHQWRVGLAEAVAWRQAGVPEGLRAAQWLTAGVTPATVAAWRAAGIDSAQAVHWHEMGFDLPAARDATKRGLTPEAAFTQAHRARNVPGPANVRGLGRMHGDAAQAFLSAGVPGHLMAGYLATNWATEDALPWAKAGLEAGDAVLWRTLGLTPAEAARLTGKGVSAADTVRDWWRAGIPFDEAADWIGAGLTPREAADQRARGVTAEQAAALRALRDQEADE
jgi:hypothetical protein